jgi:hypothetical protein
MTRHAPPNLILLAAAAISLAVLGIAAWAHARASERLHASQARAQLASRARAEIDASPLRQRSDDAQPSAAALLQSLHVCTAAAGFEPSVLAAFSPTPARPLEGPGEATLYAHRATLLLRLPTMEALGRWIRAFQEQQAAASASEGPRSSWRAIECTLTRTTTDSRQLVEFSLIVECLSENPT